jgi:hypothetical protein
MTGDTMTNQEYAKSVREYLEFIMTDTLIQLRPAVAIYSTALALYWLYHVFVVA